MAATDPVQRLHLALIEGYIRDCLGDTHYPDDVMVFIFIFFSNSGGPDWAYNITEQWDKWDATTASIDFEILNKGTFCTRKSSETVFPCVYGQRIISEGTVCWRFENRKGFHWIIGIVATTQPLITKNNKQEKILYKDCGDCYMIEGGYGNIYGRGTLLGKHSQWMFDCVGDAVCMCFDYHLGTLSYSINKHEFATAFANIDISKQYRMVVCAAGNNQSLQLQASQHIEYRR